MAVDRTEHRVQVDPDYFQFYLRRGEAPWASDAVSETGYERRLWSDGGFVYVGTHRRFGTMPVTITVLNGRPDLPDDRWQHVAEVSLSAGAPTIEVFSWGSDDPAFVVPVPTGDLRLRCAWTGLVAGRAEGLDDEFESDEQLAIQVWPEAATDSTTLRTWPDWP